MSNNIKISLEIPQNRILDLLITGFDQGILYWGKWFDNIIPIKTDKALEARAGSGYAYPLIPGGAIIIQEWGYPEQKTYKLNLPAIKKGLNIMSEKYPIHFADFIGQNEDAITADVFIQCCIFGEVKYG